MDLSAWQPYLIAIVIGLLVGIEREKAQATGKAIGVRTFLLLALAGALAGGLATLWMSVLIATFVFILIAISYFNATKVDGTELGLTTEFAAGVVFALGYIAHTRPVLATVLGPVVALVLFVRTPLHSFTRRIKASEYQAALLLLLLAVVVLNLLDDEPLDPWGVFHPQKFGMIVVILAGFEFVSYILAKNLNEKSSSLLVGLFGGFVSSTAVTLASAKEAAKSQKAGAGSYIKLIAAQVASLVELVFIIGFVAPQLLKVAAPPVLSAAALVGVGVALWAWRAKVTSSGVDLSSPLDWKGVFRLAILFAAMLAVIALAKHFLGEQGALAVSLLGGAMELHGVVLANSTMFASNQISADSAVFNILAAVSASLIAKTVICWAIAPARFAAIITAVMAVIAGVMWGVGWFYG